MIYILTGPVHSGKTSFLKKIVAELKEEKIDMAGFLSEAVFERGEPSGYDLHDLKRERAIPFIRRKGKKSWQRVGSYFFIPRALAEAQKIILQAKDASFFIADEVGPLELAQKGLWPALEKVLFESSLTLLLVVRKEVLEDFIHKLGGQEVRIFSIQEKRALSRMIEELRRNTRKVK